MKVLKSPTAHSNNMLSVNTHCNRNVFRTGQTIPGGLAHTVIRSQPGNKCNLYSLPLSKNKQTDKHVERSPMSTSIDLTLQAKP